MIFSQAVFGLNDSQTIYARDVISIVEPKQGCKVLHFGDSQAAGYPGRHIEYRMTNLGCIHDRSMAESGSSVKDWIHRKGRLAIKVEQFKPTIIILNLGGNDSKRAKTLALSEDIAELIHWLSYLPAQIIWIGPPKSCGKTQKDIERAINRKIVSQKIMDIVGPDIFIDSSEISCKYKRCSDGIHFTHDGARQYIDEIFPTIEKMLDRGFEPGLQ